MTVVEEAAGRWDSEYHAPVLAAEVLALLSGARCVLDGTLGGGGHSLALLEAGVERVVAIDRDPSALAVARERLASFGERFTAVEGNYAWPERISAIDGITFDGILAIFSIARIGQVQVIFRARFAERLEPRFATPDYLAREAARFRFVGVLAEDARQLVFALIGEQRRRIPFGVVSHPHVEWCAGAK